MFDVISMCLLFFIIWLFKMASFHYCVLFPVTTQEKRTKRMRRLGWVTKEGHAVWKAGWKARCPNLDVYPSDTKDKPGEFPGRGVARPSREKLELLVRRQGRICKREWGPAWGWGGFLIRSQEEWEEDTAFSLHTKVTDQLKWSLIRWDRFVKPI